LLEAGPKSVVVVGIEPQDIQPFGLELTEKISSKIEDLVLRVMVELSNIGIQPQKKV